MRSRTPRTLLGETTSSQGIVEGTMANEHMTAKEQILKQIDAALEMNDPYFECPGCDNMSPSVKNDLAGWGS
jgi:hypothetical protein